MKKTKVTLLLAAIAAIPAFSQTPVQDALSEAGKTKFEQVCIACHKYERSPEMIAPPAFAIQMHYSDRFGSDEAAFRRAIVDWVKAPDQAKTLMPGAIQKFKLMPPLPLPEEDLDAIAAYLFRAQFDATCGLPLAR